jgi:uncharacterized protein (TIGR03067 family)
MSRLLQCAALLAAAAVVTSAVADDKAGKGTKLDGGYTIVSGEENGKALPADHIKGSVVMFAGNRITGTDKDKKEFFAATYTLDATKTPHVIRMKSTSPKEAEATGLVKKDGDTVTLIYSLPGTPAPTEFKTKQGQLMFVLRQFGTDQKK